jgi:hypothetical protein
MTPTTRPRRPPRGDEPAPGAAAGPAGARPPPTPPPERRQAVNDRVSASTQNQAFCALLSLYQRGLQVPLEHRTGHAIDGLARYTGPRRVSRPVSVAFGGTRKRAEAGPSATQGVRHA